MADAGLELGRIMGVWKIAGPQSRDLFALALVRRCVIAALQAESYAFTDEHFAYWLAGAVVLDAEHPPLARPARRICELVVNTLSRSRCDEIVRAAGMFRAMAMPVSEPGEFGSMEDCFEAADAAQEIAVRSMFAGGSGPQGVVESLDRSGEACAPIASPGDAFGGEQAG